MPIRTILTASFAIALFVLTGHGATAEGARTTKLVVPVAPGGALDYVARLLAEQIQRTQGQTIVVESRPGPARPSEPKRWRALFPTATHSCSPLEAIFSSVRTFER